MYIEVDIMPEKAIEAIMKTLDKDGMPKMCSGLTKRECAEKIYAVAKNKKKNKPNTQGGELDGDIFYGE
jgi:hypothetical protein